MILNGAPHLTRSDEDHNTCRGYAKKARTNKGAVHSNAPVEALAPHDGEQPKNDFSRKIREPCIVKVALQINTGDHRLPKAGDH
jgi:hypothetical protein